MSVLQNFKQSPIVPIPMTYDAQLGGVRCTLKNTSFARLLFATNWRSPGLVGADVTDGTSTPPLGFVSLPLSLYYGTELRPNRVHYSPNNSNIQISDLYIAPIHIPAATDLIMTIGNLNASAANKFVAYFLLGKP